MFIEANSMHHNILETLRFFGAIYKHKKILSLISFF